MVSIDINKEIRRAVDTGAVSFGWRSTERNVLKGNGKLVILSTNVMPDISEKTRHIASIAGIPVFDFNGTNRELGSVCGKPFVVSVMLVQDSGKGKVLDVLEETKEKKTVNKRKKR